MENKDHNQINKSSSIKSEDIKDLKEILEIEKLSRLLEQFYSATGLSNSIVDLKGNILHGVGWKSICTEFHRKHKTSSERCLKSDTILANRLKKKGKYSIYNCQNGMVDAAIPIMIDGVHVANFFIGQFFFETPDKDFFIKQAEELGFDKEKYLKALEECQVYNKETILRYLDFFSGLINMIGESALKTINQKNQVAEITNKEAQTAELIIDKEQIEAANATISKAWKYNRSIIEASLDPFVTIGLNGKITDVNYATEQATGLPREKIIGTDFSEYFTEPGKAQAGYQQVLKDGKVVDYELNLKHISGDSIFVLFNASVYKDDEGEIIGVFAAARDFTATRRAEKYTRSLIEANLDHLTIIGLNGKITDVNYATEQATGLPREKLIGTDFSEYVTEPDKAQAGFQQVLKDGKVVDFELNLKHISGTSIPVLYNASVYKDDEGQIIGVLAVARDISAIKKYEGELIDFKNNLESANKELETFSYSVSHDLKTPLRHITGYLSLLVKKYIALLPEEGRHYLDNISYSAKNMEELVDGLLQFLKTGKTEMNQKLLDMNEIVAALIQPYREQDQQHRIEFHINPLPSAFGDLEMIKSAWNNLIENAIKFSKKKDLAEISIGAEKNETEIIYYIKDNGTGFDMNYASKLFAVFQRLHSREDYDGVGIGLATIQRIITRHGGRIWAESKLGEGAAFYFTLMKRKKGE